MTKSKATRSIIDTHRHIFGPKLRQKFVENIGFDDSKPFPQANAGEMFFYRESVDVDYSMEIQRQSGVSSCVNSYGGEVETFAQHIIKASTVDTLKFLHDESFEIRDRFPDEVACMANAHALEENTRAVIDPLISKKEACCISISTSYGAGIAIEQAPHLRINRAGRIQTVVFLITLYRNSEIVAVDAVNFAGREPGAVQ